MRYDHFSMLPERAFQPRNGRHGMTLEGGGGGPSSTTTQTSNIPDWMRPQVEALLGGATKEYFDTKMVPGKKAVYDAEGNMISEGTKPTYEITGVKPFVPYSEDPTKYVAGFNPQQQQVFQEAAGMATPGQFGTASQFAGQAGLGGLSTAGQALGYGAQGAGIGQLGLGYGGYGADIGQQAMGYGAQAAGMGGLYEQMATSPGSMQAYMSPYVRNVIEQQKESAVRDAQKAQLAQNLGAARQGTYGGSRQLLAATERERALGSQMGQIEAQGLQKAFEEAQRAQQFGITAGLQGLQGAQQGLGTALQGGQLGLSGIQQALAGQQLGLQGVQGAQAGYGMLGQAGTSLANIGTAQQAADLARMQFQAEQGATQQAREQQIINQAIQNYGMAREYPYEQLARYSGLLRGYYTPTNVQSTYQAYNPAAQLTGLVAQGAGAYGAMGGFGKKEGGKIKEKRYAEGGITSIDQKVLADPTSFSPEMINNGMESGSISDMIGAIGLSAIENERNNAMRQEGLSSPLPEGTVLSNLQEATMGQGIDAAPSNMNMAGGGIVAFAGEDGSLVEDEEKQPSSIADFVKIAERYLKKPKSEQETEYEEKLRRRPEELSKQREMDRYLALMNFGAAMGGAKTGNFLQAVSEGTKAAIPGIASSEKAYREGMAGSEKELAGLGAKTRAEEIEAAKMGIDLYGKAEQRVASKSNMKEYAENYVKKMQRAGDTRPVEELWNEGATKYSMITAAPRYESAAASQTTAAANVADKIGKLRESIKNDQVIASRDTKGMSAAGKAAVEAAKKRVAEVEAQIAALQGGRTPGAAPSAGNQITVGGKTFAKPPNMTDAQWEAYKKYAAGAK